MCLAIYELDPVCFFTASGLKWKAALKITKVILDLSTDIDIIFFYFYFYIVFNSRKKHQKRNMPCYSLI